MDRAALDVAIELGIPYRGWVPRGSMAEDGPLPDRYTGLRETDSDRPEVRTRRNVRDTDATLVIAFGDVTGGTALARDTAEELGRPILVVNLRGTDLHVAVESVRRWIDSLAKPLRLNVAGPRASGVPEGYAAAARLLRHALTRSAMARDDSG